MQQINTSNNLKNGYCLNLPNNTKTFKLLEPNNEILFKRSQEYIFKQDDKNLINIVNSLFATLLHLGCIGLAAPQIGISKRIIIFGMPHKHPKRLHEPPIPYMALINPKITFFSKDKTIDYESCRSVPGRIGWVARSNLIKYQAYNTDRELIEEEAVGLKSRIIQHEIDHLDGILITKIAVKIEQMDLYKADPELLMKSKANLNNEFGYKFL